MTQRAEIDVVRQAFDAFNRGDWDAAEELADPEIEWEAPPGLGAVDSPNPLRGAEAVLEMWASFFSVWDEWEMAAGTFKAGRGGEVFVPVRFTARGHGSGVPMTMDFFQVYTLRAGRILRVSSHLDEPDALKAAGLSE